MELEATKERGERQMIREKLQFFQIIEVLEKERREPRRGELYKDNDEEEENFQEETRRDDH